MTINISNRETLLILIMAQDNLKKPTTPWLGCGYPTLPCSYPTLPCSYPTLPCSCLLQCKKFYSNSATLQD